MKITKRLLDRGIFQQMVDSQQEISNFEQLKSYLIATHGNQMSNFQHLSRAWDLQRRDGEKLTDFARRLENTLREATVHIKNKFKKDNTKELTVDTTISLVGAMLMSEKIKTWTPNIYPHLVKTMDNDYTADGIASAAQRYLDRGVKTDNTTDYKAIAYYNQPQRPKKPKDTPGQQITVNKQLPKRKTHTSNTPPNNPSYNQTQGPKPGNSPELYKRLQLLPRAQLPISTPTRSPSPPYSRRNTYKWRPNPIHWSGFSIQTRREMMAHQPARRTHHHIFNFQQHTTQ